MSGSFPDRASNELMRFLGFVKAPNTRKKKNFGVMDEILRTLQYSTDNELRIHCQQSLRQCQERSPCDFLEFITPIVLRSDPAAEMDAFFAASVMLEFIREFWRVVPEDGQVALQQRLLSFITTQSLPSPKKPLGTKICSILALITKLQLPRKAHKTPSGAPQLPSVLENTLSALLQSAQHSAPVRMQSLLAIHCLLKELLSKRIGKVFDLACAYISPTLCQWVISTGADPQSKELFVMCLKIALRVYGHGLFQPDAYQHIIQVVFQLAGEVSQQQQQPDCAALHLTVRALEYGCKILLVATESFGPKLSDLGVAFFTNTDGNAQTLFRFVFLALQACWNARQHSSVETFTDKLACRCMRVITEFSSRSDSGDDFSTAVLQQFAQSDTCFALVRVIVEQYLADDVNVMQERWVDDPEGLVADLDVVDDDESPGSCAEQLFLSLTSNAVSSPTCVPCAWSVVNELLQAQENIGAAVTAGLHAIGLGYSTLASDPTQYHSFLYSKLLPMLQRYRHDGAGRLTRSSLEEAMILRRAIWVIGMWCESVVETSDRQAVHIALGGLLDPATDAVMLLTTLRAVEHFLTDYSFDVGDMGGMGSALDTSCNVVLPVYVSRLLACLRHVIPRLRTASMIKEIVALCLSLSEKGALPKSGEAMAFVLQPAVDRFTTMATRLESVTHAQGDDLGVDDSVGPAEMSAFSMILETLTSVVKWTTSNASIWRHLPLVYLCTDPSHAVSSWTQDCSWELLLKMIHYTQVGVGGELLDAETRRCCSEVLEWSVRHLDRDFDCLPLVIRCVSGLLVLLGPPRGEGQIQFLVQKVVTSLFSTDGPVFQAYAGLACILVVADPPHSVPSLLRPLLQYHHAVSDTKVQEDEQLPMIAAILSHVILQRSVDVESCMGPEERMMCSSAAPGSSQTLAEKWSLTLDVTANMYAAQCIANAGYALVQRGLITSAEDLAMVQAAHESIEDLIQQSMGGGAASSNGGAAACHASPARGCPGVSTFVTPRDDATSLDSVRGNADMEFSDIPESREPVDVLLEFLGDGDAGCSNDVPHALRIAALFQVSTPASGAVVQR